MSTDTKDKPAEDAENAEDLGQAIPVLPRTCGILKTLRVAVSSQATREEQSLAKEAVEVAIAQLETEWIEVCEVLRKQKLLNRQDLAKLQEAVQAGTQQAAQLDRLVDALGIREVEEDPVVVILHLIKELKADRERLEAIVGEVRAQLGAGWWHYAMTAIHRGEDPRRAIDETRNWGGEYDERGTGNAERGATDH